MSVSPDAAERWRERHDREMRKSAERWAAAKRARPSRAGGARVGGGRPQTVETRAKLRARAFANHYADAAALEDASRLRRERVERGWTMPELALRAGLARTSVWQAENGREVRDRTWQQLSFALYGHVGNWRRLRDDA